jgi:hypothetical protein
MHHALPEPLIRKVDAIQIHVPDLEAGLLDASKALLITDAEGNIIGSRP